MEEQTIVRQEERGGGAGIGFFLFGAVLGAVAGVLLAPEEGKVNRRKVAEWFRERSRLSKAAIQAGKERYGELAAVVRDQHSREKEPAGR